jgi:hypothetical protein
VKVASQLERREGGDSKRKKRLDFWEGMEE